MASPKTGGNKKQASLSDTNYWNRAKISKYNETHRAKRIAKHRKAHPKWKEVAVVFPKVPAVREQERCVFSGIVQDHRSWSKDADGDSYVKIMPKLIIKNGVVLDVVSAVVRRKGF